MISSPVLPEDPDPQVNLADDLDVYDKTQWRFFRWDPVHSRYIELKTPDWSGEQDFDYGRGYWIISRNTRTIDIQGAPRVVDEIVLKGDGDGWNQIGNIYLQDFAIGMFPNCNLLVTPISGGLPYQLNNPSNPYTHVTLKEYTGGLSYTDIGDEAGENLETGKGYWLKNIYGEDVILEFNPAGLTSISTTNATNLPGQDFFARVAQQEDPPDPPPAIESSSSGSFSGGSGGGGGGCFIATATYGEYDHPRVQLLRELRDRYLLKNSFGRIFVDMYYRYSPPLARFVTNRKPIKALVRFSLMPVIGISAIVSKMNTYGFLIVMVFPLLGSFFFLRRRTGA